MSYAYTLPTVIPIVPLTPFDLLPNSIYSQYNPTFLHNVPFPQLHDNYNPNAWYDPIQGAYHNPEPILKKKEEKKEKKEKTSKNEIYLDRRTEAILKKWYKKKRNIGKEDRKQIMKETGLDGRIVMLWFRRRREEEKKSQNKT